MNGGAEPRLTSGGEAATKGALKTFRAKLGHRLQRLFEQSPVVLDLMRYVTPNRCSSHIDSHLRKRQSD